jgi:hypothetical protein
MKECSSYIADMGTNFGWHNTMKLCYIGKENKFWPFSLLVGGGGGCGSRFTAPGPSSDGLYYTLLNIVFLFKDYMYPYILYYYTICTFTMYIIHRVEICKKRTPAIFIRFTLILILR